MKRRSVLRRIVLSGILGGVVAYVLKHNSKRPNRGESGASRKIGEPIERHHPSDRQLPIAGVERRDLYLARGKMMPSVATLP